MKSFLLCLTACLVALLMYSCKAKEQRAIDLKCEYLVNPIGIDKPIPRLSWMLPSCDGLSQSAYMVNVDTDSMSLAAGESGIWNSGVVSSDSTVVTYAGLPLKPFTRYFWRVFYWNQEGNKSCPSHIAVFETGPMNDNDWKGQWISDDRSCDYGPAADFRKEFQVDKRVRRARAYVTAGGIFELTVNGNKAGDHVLDPMFTRFDRRNLFVTFDVTSLLQRGDNVLGVSLGNGWYNHQPVAAWLYDMAPWRARPRFKLNLHVMYEDGTVDTVVTDSTWRVSDSPVIYNNIYTAEHYDARKERPGWTRIGFNDDEWANAVVVGAPSVNVVSQQMHPVRVVSELKPLAMFNRGDTSYVFTFAENMAGTVRIKVTGKEGTVLRIRHGEILDSLGNLDMSNINYFLKPRDSADLFQTDFVVLSGNGEDIFTPKFNYKGFQYVEVVSSEPISLSKNNIVALKMHSDVPQVGSIRSSNSLLDSIWKATNRSYLANLFGYPTDCPQREKNGWTGDAHIAIETALFNYDAITIYEKWLNDFKDEQQSNGVLPAIIPTNGWGYTWANGTDWTSAVAIIPWQIYMFYGDSRLLEQMYENIKSYVGYVESISPDGLTDWGLGDWLPANAKSDKELTCSIYYYIDAKILSKAAGLFGKKSDEAYYGALSEKIRKAINDKFLDREKGIYCSGSQTELSAPLYWGIVPSDVRSKVAKNLYEKVKDNDFHLDVGLLGSKTLLGALSDNGYADAAYRIATQDSYPSWGYWLTQGLTTLSENWKLQTTGKKDASLNHIMFGEIGAWMYKTLGGINVDEQSPGFKHILLKPMFVDGLDSFYAEHMSMHGKIVSSWEKKDGKVVYKVKIPSNTRATFFPPDETVGKRDTICFEPGSHTLCLPIKK